MPLQTLVTGANGRVGRVLRGGLADLPVTFTGRAQVDAGNRAALVQAMTGYDQVVHLATPLRGWVFTPEDLMLSVTMASAVLDAARAAEVKRVLIPSSVIATATAQLAGRTRVRVEDALPPETDYGRSRLQVEELARAAAQGGMEVVCVRLGVLRHPDFPSGQALWRPHWLSHEDCALVFRAALTAPLSPGRFSLFYAVSDLPERVFDTSNPFGWTPRTHAPGFRRALVAALHRLNTGVRGRLQIRTRLKNMFTRVKAEGSKSRHR